MSEPCYQPLSPRALDLLGPLGLVSRRRAVVPLTLHGRLAAPAQRYTGEQGGEVMPRNGLLQDDRQCHPRDLFPQPVRHRWRARGLLALWGRLAFALSAAMPAAAHRLLTVVAILLASVAPSSAASHTWGPWTPVSEESEPCWVQVSNAGHQAQGWRWRSVEERSCDGGTDHAAHVEKRRGSWTACQLPGGA